MTKHGRPGPGHGEERVRGVSEPPAISEPDPASEEFLALASAVRAYHRLVEQSRREPVSIDPVDLLEALAHVGEASLVMVSRAGAL